MEQLPAGDHDVASGHDRPLGTASLVHPTRAEALFPYRPGAVWLGRGPAGLPTGFADDRHVCLVGGTRGGKGSSFIINNLCLWPGSVVVVDPKGEDATITAARRGAGARYCTGLGQKVCVLDPFRTASVDDEYRASFNPFDALDPDSDRSVAEADRLAAAVVVVNPNAKEPFWDQKARDMVKCLILHILTDPVFEGRRNLVTLRRLALRGEVEVEEALERQGVEDVPPAHRLLWQSVALNPAFGGLVADLGVSLLNLVENSDRSGQYESVLQVVQTNTAFLDSNEMRACVSSSTFQLAELKTDRKGISLFICLPQRYMSTHNRWIRMMLSLIVREMEMVPGKPKAGWPVLAVLDEFAGLERLRDIEEAAAQSAGHGLKLMFVVQNLVQLKAVYRDEWETFIGNAGLKIFFDLGEHFSREYVSKLLGKMESRRAVGSESDTTGTMQGESDNLTKGKAHGTSGGTTDTRTETESEGTSDSSGGSWGKGKSVSGSGRGWWRGDLHFSESENWSASHQHTVTKSKSTAIGKSTQRGWSDTDQESSAKGTSKGTSEAHMRGSSESVHARDLLTPDEIGRSFARVDDAAHGCYPGLTLVIAGEKPFVTRRTTYYEDHQFIGRFRPHPDHPFEPPRKDEIATFALEAFRPDLPDLTVTMSVAPGAVIRRGEPIGLVSTTLDGTRVNAGAVRAPRSGRTPEDGAEERAYPSVLASVGLMMGLGTKVPGGLLGLLPLHATLHYDDGGARGEPFADVAAFIEKRRTERVLAETRAHLQGQDWARRAREAEEKERRARARISQLREQLRQEDARGLRKWAWRSGAALAVFAACGVMVFLSGVWSVWTLAGGAALWALAHCGQEWLLSRELSRDLSDQRLWTLVIAHSAEAAALKPYLLIPEALRDLDERMAREREVREILNRPRGRTFFKKRRT